MAGRFVGRCAGRDGRMVGDEARKSLVATFEGRHHVAERNEKGDLEIFAVHDEHGMPAIEMGATQDGGSAPERLRAMNKNAARFWSGR